MLTQYQVGDIIKTRWNSVGKIVELSTAIHYALWIVNFEPPSGTESYIYTDDIVRLLSKEEAAIWLLEN